MNTLKPRMNESWPNGSKSVSARGLSSILMRLAKAEGRGKDLQIDARCNVNDIARAAMQLNHDEMMQAISVEEGSK